MKLIRTANHLRGINIWAAYGLHSVRGKSNPVHVFVDTHNINITQTRKNSGASLSAQQDISAGSTYCPLIEHILHAEHFDPQLVCILAHVINNAHRLESPNAVDSHRESSPRN